jgi:hypothetical protein
MVSAFDSEAFTVVNAARDAEDHGVVEEVGAGEAEAAVALGLGKMGILLVIVGVKHIVIAPTNRTFILFYHNNQGIQLHL